MGRLTLNVLLSFAQFEREVTGERIRDKIAASKRKGMWMGGVPPLGYATRDRKLIVIDHEAETVRLIFRRYAAIGSVRLLGDELEARGITSKSWTSASGKSWGGKPIGRGALYLMLQNPIYRGEIVHKDETYPGEHAAIIEPALWDAVTARLAENAVERNTGRRVRNPSLLTGLLFDGEGHRMTPTHAIKNGRRYRYYVSRPLIVGSSAAAAGIRISAAEIEQDRHESDPPITVGARERLRDLPGSGDRASTPTEPDDAGHRVRRGMGPDVTATDASHPPRPAPAGRHAPR